MILSQLAYLKMIWIKLKKRTNIEETIYKKHLLQLLLLVNWLYAWAYKTAAGRVKYKIMSLSKAKVHSKPERVKTAYRRGK